MNKRFLLISATALLAGFAGGLAPRLLTAQKKPSDEHYGTIRATRIELVDETGKVRAFIGTNKQRKTAVVFLDDQGQERVIFGVWSGSSTPFMAMRGADGNDRFAIGFVPLSDERPYMVLRDHEQTSVSLGFFENDAPDPRGDDWGLRFHQPHQHARFGLDSLAAIGLYRDAKDGKSAGFVVAEGKDGRVWSEPR